MEYKYVTTPSHTFSKNPFTYTKGGGREHQEQIDAIFLHCHRRIDRNQRQRPKKF